MLTNATNKATVTIAPHCAAMWDTHNLTHSVFPGGSVQKALGFLHKLSLLGLLCDGSAYLGPSAAAPLVLSFTAQSDLARPFWLVKQLVRR